MLHVALQFARLQPDGTVSGMPLRNTLPGSVPAGRVVTQQLRVASKLVAAVVQVLEKVTTASGQASVSVLPPTPAPVMVHLMPWKT